MTSKKALAHSLSTGLDYPGNPRRTSFSSNETFFGHSFGPVSGFVEGEVGWDCRSPSTPRALLDRGPRTATYYREGDGPAARSLGLAGRIPWAVLRIGEETLWLVAWDETHSGAVIVNEAM